MKIIDETGNEIFNPDFELGYLIKNPSPYFITSKILIIPVLFASVP